MHQDRKFRTAASLAVTVLLSVALFALFFSIELMAGYLNPRLFVESLRASDYGVEMEREMLDKQKELFSSNGLPESLTEEIWKENDAYLAFYKYIDGGDALDGGQGQREVIEDYLKRQKVYETDSIKEAAEIVTEESKAICRRYVYPSFVTGFRQFVSERRGTLIVTAAVSAVLAVVLTALLFFWHHKKYRALRYVAGSFFAAAVWNAAGALAIRYGGWIAIPGETSSYYQNFLETYQARGLWPWNIISIAACCMTVILLFAVSRMRKR